MIRWTPAAKKKVRAGRQGDEPRGKSKAFDVAGARAAVAKAWEACAQRWTDGLPGADDERRRTMEAVLASFASKEWTPTNAEIEGARAAMLTDYEDGQREEDVIEEWLVPLWVATAGGAFAVSALAYAGVLRRHWHVRPGKESGHFLALATEIERKGRTKLLPGWGALREELGRSTLAKYREALQRANDVRATAPLAVRCGITYAFPTERRWAAEDLKACIESRGFPEFGATLLADADVDLAMRVAKLCPSFALREEHVYTALDVHGGAAVPLFEVLIARFAADKAAREAGMVARALSLVRDERAAAVFARFLGTPALRTVATKYFAGAPELVPTAFARAFARPDAPGRAAGAQAYVAWLAEQGKGASKLVAPLGADDKRVLADLEALATADSSAKSTPERAAVAAAWRRIEKWLSAKHPSKTEMLADGASKDDVAALERAVGRELPAELRASLFEHDGESDASVGLFEGYVLLSAEGILDEWRSYVEANKTMKPEDAAVEEPLEGVQPRHWDDGWIPIASDGGGNAFCVDTNPAKGGTRGQVIFYDHETGPYEVVAEGMLDFLTVLAKGMEARKVYIWSDASVHGEREG